MWRTPGLFEPHFVALMQINSASHAIHQAKDPGLAARIRKAYADINDRYNATITTGDTAEDAKALDVYEDELKRRVDVTRLAKGPAEKAWDVAGFLGEVTAAEVSAGTHDDRVTRFCFAAQVLYVAQDSDEDKDHVAMSVMRGRVSEDIRDDLRAYVTTVVEGLRECPLYEFRVYWGFPEMMHRMNITQPDFFATYGFSPFTCPYDLANTSASRF